jgi:hypothetical protein
LTLVPVALVDVAAQPTSRVKPRRVSMSGGSGRMCIDLAGSPSCLSAAFCSSSSTWARHLGIAARRSRCSHLHRPWLVQDRLGGRAVAANSPFAATQFRRLRPTSVMSTTTRANGGSTCALEAESVVAAAAGLTEIALGEAQRPVGGASRSSPSNEVTRARFAFLVASELSQPPAVGRSLSVEHGKRRRSGCLRTLPVTMA